jgi:serine/threonine-protein kinase
MGTPAFMPPEQARGLWAEVDAQSDLWAVGATLFTCLTGRLVHDAETMNKVLIAAMTVPARPIGVHRPELPLAVKEVVDRALAFAKGDRWADARAMQDAVREAYRGVRQSAGDPLHELAPAPLTSALPLPSPVVSAPLGPRLVDTQPTPPRADGARRRAARTADRTKLGAAVGTAIGVLLAVILTRFTLPAHASEVASIGGPPPVVAVAQPSPPGPTPGPTGNVLPASGVTLGTAVRPITDRPASSREVRGAPAAARVRGR